MRLVVFAAFFLSFGIAKSCAQVITPLYKYTDAYVDSLQKSLIVPSLSLKIDNKNRLFHSNSALFIPEGDFEFCLYEVIDDKYLLITAINKTQFNNPALYVLPKRKVKLYELGHYDRNWEYDFNAKKLVGIRNGFIILKNKEGKEECLRL